MSRQELPSPRPSWALLEYLHGVNALELRWHRTWADLGLAEPGPVVLERLLARYRERHRAYHTVQHLEECFALLDELRDLARDAAMVELALWYHDAVYQPRRADNEQASADLARADLDAAGAPGSLTDPITAMILATTHQAAPPPGDTEILIDIDLAILGAEPPRFAEYERQIRKEYSWVPEFLFRKKRSEVLEGFLARPQIYRTAILHTRLEERARRNLTTAIG